MVQRLCRASGVCPAHCVRMGRQGGETRVWTPRIRGPRVAGVTCCGNEDGDTEFMCAGKEAMVSLFASLWGPFGGSLSSSGNK